MGPAISGHKATLSPRQRAVLLSILGCSTQVEAAKAVSVSPRTIGRWVGTVAFRTERERLELEREQSALGLLRSAGERAVATLVTLLDHQDPRVRRQAAGTLLDSFLRARRQDVETDLEQLRELLSGGSPESDS